MLFIPTLPVKAEFTAMLRMLSNAGSAENAKIADANSSANTLAKHFRE